MIVEIIYTDGKRGYYIQMIEGDNYLKNIIIRTRVRS
jgi:hypothetical protein